MHCSRTFTAHTRRHALGGRGALLLGPRGGRGEPSRTHAWRRPVRGEARAAGDTVMGRAIPTGCPHRVALSWVRCRAILAGVLPAATTPRGGEPSEGGARAPPRRARGGGGRRGGRRDDAGHGDGGFACGAQAPCGMGRRQGLTLAHFTAQLEDLRDTSLTVELNLSTFGTHPRVRLGQIGDKVSLS